MKLPAPRVPRLIARSGAVLLCVVVWYVTVAPVALGGPLSLVLIRGTSMEPTYETGDLVIGYRSVAVEPGDVVIFRGPGEAPVIHRLRALEGDRLVTRGDNLPADDPWDTGREDLLGTARFRLAGVGSVIRNAAQPPVLGVLAAVLVVSLILLRGDRDPEDATSTTASRPDRRGRDVAIGAVVVAAFGVGAVVVGAAASLIATTDELASLSVTGPFDTYVDAPANGGGGNGNGGGGNGNGGGKP